MSFLNAYIGYYFSVRSGNWLLRNSCLRALLPLIFAYNHNKYEELCCTAIIDSLTLSTHFTKRFLSGEWTVSAKGRPYHNLALDEAHESIINLRLKTITSRPSHFRTVELSNFMSYLDKVVRGFESMVYMNKQNEPVQQRKRYICQRTTRMIDVMKDSDLFSNSTTRALSNVLSDNYRVDSNTAQDLLSISVVGNERMGVYVQEHILPLPTTGPKKRRKRARKLATFTHKSTTTNLKEGKRRENELTNIAKNAMSILQAHGITAQTSPYPLAIADLHGNMRASPKSQFLNSLSGTIEFDKAVSNTCPILENPPSDLSVMVDLLYFLHMLPPPSITTFFEFFQLLWQKTVIKYVHHQRSQYLYIIIDKPNFLPPPRSIVHKTRASKSKAESTVEPVVTDESQIPHGKAYSATLANCPQFKTKLIDYVTTNFQTRALSSTTQHNFSLVLDSPSLQTLNTITGGNIYSSDGNEHGEADNTIWHHCINTPSNNILIVSSDTDTWVYGLGICESGRLDEKQVYVQRGNSDSFINIKEATSLISNHPILSTMSYPALSLTALYVLTGCDYVSSFYRCTKTKFLEILLENLAFICPDGQFLRMEMGEFQHINESPWIRLVTAVYFSKYKTFFHSRPISYIYSLICDHPDSEEAQRLLSSINISTKMHTPLYKWHDFIRKVSYHVPKVSKVHELKLIPSIRALILHLRRANYIVKLSLSVPFLQSPFLPCFDQFGWQTQDGSVCITWDDGVSMESDSEEEDAEESEDDSSYDNEEISNGLQVVGDIQEESDTD